MRKLFMTGLMALALLLPAGSAFAIGEQYGRVTGIVYDQNGAELAGVSLTLTSPALLGGARKLATAKDGSFTFNNLPPGDYRMLIEQPGLKTIDKRNIGVTVGKTVTLYLVMELPTKTDTVTVIADRPVVDTTSMTQGGTVTTDFADNIPTTRDYQGLSNILPGTVDINGGNPNIHGAAFDQNSYLIDGMEVTDPATGTFSANLNFDQIQQVEVSTGGLDAEYSALGGVINVVTKSGGNDFELDSSYYINNTTLSPSFNFGSDPLSGKLRFQAPSGNSRAFSEANVNAGGPIIKDKLWYYVSFDKVSSIRSIPTEAPFLIAHPPRDFEGITARAKLTYQPNTSNTFTLSYGTDPASISNIDQSPGEFADPNDPNNTAEDHLNQGGFIVSGRWDWVVSSNLLFKAQVGLTHERLTFFPESPAFQAALDAGDQVDNQGVKIDALNFAPQGRFDLGLNVAVGDGAAGFFEDDLRNRYQADASLTYIKDGWAGSHTFKTGIQLAPTSIDSTVGVPGFAQFLDFGGSLVPSPDGNGFRYQPACSATFDVLNRVTTLGDNPQPDACFLMISGGDNPSQNPFDTLSKTTQTGLFVQDEWKPTPFLTVKPGLRFDAFASSNTLNNDGQSDQSLAYSGFGPRIGVAWDPTHDGKTLLSAYAGQITDSGNLDLPSISAKAGLQEDEVFFDPTQGIYDFNSAIRFGGAGGTLLSCDKNLKNDPLTADLFQDCRAPVEREASFIAERQVGDATAIGFNATFRHEYHMFENDEVNLIFNDKGDAVVGAVNGDPNQSIKRLGTFDQAFIDYKGIDLYVRGKPSERSQVLASYTFSRNAGTKDEDAGTGFVSHGTSFLDDPRQTQFFFGPLPNDNTHVIKLQGDYSFDFGLVLGASYVYESGAPFDRLFQNNFSGGFSDRRAPRGFDPGSDLNNPNDDVELRLPPINEVDIRAQYSLAPLTGQKLSFIADIFNILNLSTPDAVGEQNGVDFERVVDRQGPLSIQLGIRYVY